MKKDQQKRKRAVKKATDLINMGADPLSIPALLTETETKHLGDMSRADFLREFLPKLK